MGWTLKIDKESSKRQITRFTGIIISKLHALQGKLAQQLSDDMQGTQVLLECHF
jgi:hypothetical protein